MTSRAGQSGHQGANLPERDNLTDHDAAPAAIVQLPSGDHASSGGGSVGTDKAEPLTAVGTGNAQEPLTFWAVLLDGEQADNEWTYRTREAADEAAAYILSHAPDAPVRVVPLVLLTAAERRAIREAADAYALNDEDADCERIAHTLRGLLARTPDRGNRQ